MEHSCTPEDEEWRSRGKASQGQNRHIKVATEQMTNELTEEKDNRNFDEG
jgi:hypothetical protein